MMLFLVTEITLRFTPEEKIRRWSDFKYQPDTLLGYRYLPNSKGTFCNVAFSNNYYFNSLGFPGDEFSPVKKQGTYRIIVVGASDDIGFNTDGPKNYINLVNSYFKTNKIKAEIINCSIDGSGKELRKLEFIKGECLTYHPDLILFCGRFPFEERFRYRTTYKNIRIEYEYPNTYLDSAKAFIDEKIDHKCFKLYMYDYSYIFRYICKYYYDNKNKDDFKLFAPLKKYLKKNDKLYMGYIRGKIFWLLQKSNEKKNPKRQTIYFTREESLKKLYQVYEELSGNEVQFMFFTKYSIPLEKKQYFIDSNVPLLSLDIPYKEEYNFGELDGHSSQKGHLAIAQRLYKVLTDSIVPQKYMYPN